VQALEEPPWATAHAITPGEHGYEPGLPKRESPENCRNAQVVFDSFICSSTASEAWGPGATPRASGRRKRASGSGFRQTPMDLA